MGRRRRSSAAMPELPEPTCSPPTSAIAALIARVQACRLCPGMEGRRRVLSEANGRPGAAVLFVGEAPGRLGADRTGVPFHGDQSGRRFEALLAAAGWTREEVFVTNAVLCNPRAPHGRNRPPTRGELANCRQHLLDTLRVVDPRLVVALGRRALEALGALHPHGLALRRDVARPVSWLDGRWLVALYHPALRAAVHRAFAQQVEDWQRVREFLRGPTSGGDGRPMVRLRASGGTASLPSAALTALSHALTALQLDPASEQ